MLDVLLLSFPNRNIDYPALSLPTLTACLKKDGFSVEQRDLNMEIRDRLLEADILKILKDRVMPALCLENLNDTKVFDRLRQIVHVLAHIDRQWTFTKFQRTKVLMQERRYELVFNEKEYFDMAMGLFKLNRGLHQFLDLYVYHPTIFQDCGVEDPIGKIIEDLIGFIRQEQPCVVGVTVLNIQRNFSLWFAKKLREVYSGKIVFGGADPTRFGDLYLTYFDFLDCIFTKEAERSFPLFLAKLRKESSNFASIPGIIYRTGKEIRNNEPEPINPLDISTPDFSGFLLDKYLSPVLPVQASRGCYWKKCKFCIHWRTYASDYCRPIQDTVDDLEYLSRKYHTPFFHFTDDELPVKLGNRICEEILRRNLRLRWLTYARLENGFTKKILDRWYQAGARVIEWGLESASQRILDSIQKGIKISVAQRVLDDVAEVGILSKLFCFHNYPGETIQDLQMTLDFLKHNILKKKVRPFLAIRNRLFLLKGSILFEEAIGVDGGKLFRKVWVPSNGFSIEAAYEDLERDYYTRRILVDRFLEEMQGYIEQNNIFTTDDENVTMDLVLIDVKDRGVKLAKENN